MGFFMFSTLIFGCDHFDCFSGDEDTVIPFGGTRRLINQLAEMNNLSTTIPYSVWFDGGQVYMCRLIFHLYSA